MKQLMVVNILLIMSERCPIAAFADYLHFELRTEKLPFLLRFIFFCMAAARTALPLTSSGKTGLVGRDIAATLPPPMCIFLGVETPVPPVLRSRRGNCTLRVSSASSVTHSSSLLLTVHKHTGRSDNYIHGGVI